MATIPKIRDFKMAVFKIQDSETLTILNSPELEILRLVLKKAKISRLGQKLRRPRLILGTILYPSDKYVFLDK